MRFQLVAFSRRIIKIKHCQGASYHWELYRQNNKLNIKLLKNILYEVNENNYFNFRNFNVFITNVPRCTENKSKLKCSKFLA